MTNPKFATLKDIGYEPIMEKEKDILAVAINEMPGDPQAPMPQAETLPYFSAWYVIYSLLQYIEKHLEH